MKTVHALGLIALLIKTVQNPVVNPVEKKTTSKKNKKKQYARKKNQDEEEVGLVEAKARKY